MTGQIINKEDESTCPPLILACSDPAEYYGKSLCHCNG